MKIFNQHAVASSLISPDHDLDLHLVETSKRSNPPNEEKKPFLAPTGGQEMLLSVNPSGYSFVWFRHKISALGGYLYLRNS